MNSSSKIFGGQFRVALSLLSMSLCMLSNTSHCQNQQQGGRYAVAKIILTGQGYSICDDKNFDLAQGQTASFTRTFYEYTDYKIIAVSDDNNVTNIKVFVYYPDGTVYIKDSDSNSTGEVTFSPSGVLSLKVVFKNSSSKTPNYHSTIRLLIGSK